jgi:hypothetical protein
MGEDNDEALSAGAGIWPGRRDRPAQHLHHLEKLLGAELFQAIGGQLAALQVFNRPLHAVASRHL